MGTPQRSGTLAKLLVLVLVVLFFGIAGFVLTPRLIGRRPPEAPPLARLPAWMSVLVAELPLDSAGTTPIGPASLVISPLGAGGTEPGIRVPEFWLPPGVAVADVSPIATFVAGAAYRSGLGAPTVSAFVLQLNEHAAVTLLADGHVPAESPSPVPFDQFMVIAGRVMLAMGVAASDARLAEFQTARGTVNGYRLSNGVQTVYLLEGSDETRLVVMTVGGQTALPFAEQLIGQLGRGLGPLAAPGALQPLAGLPETAPPGLTLAAVEGLDQTDAGTPSDELFPAPAGGLARLAGSAVGSLTPARTTVSAWVDQNAGHWQIACGVFESAAAARVAGLFAPPPAAPSAGQARVVARHGARTCVVTAPPNAPLALAQQVAGALR